MSHHRLDAAPETVHWGFFDATLKPLLTIDSGDTVTISTVSGMPSRCRRAPLRSRRRCRDPRSVTQNLPGHICTGPVAVQGRQGRAGAGGRIEDIELHYDWGYNMIRPLAGALPDDFDEPR